MVSQGNVREKVRARECVMVRIRRLAFRRVRRKRVAPLCSVCSLVQARVSLSKSESDLVSDLKFYDFGSTVIRVVSECSRRCIFQLYTRVLPADDHLWVGRNGIRFSRFSLIPQVNEIHVRRVFGLMRRVETLMPHCWQK